MKRLTSLATVLGGFFVLSGCASVSPGGKLSSEVAAIKISNRSTASTTTDFYTCEPLSSNKITGIRYRLKANPSFDDNPESAQVAIESSPVYYGASWSSLFSNVPFTNELTMRARSKFPAIFVYAIESKSQYYQVTYIAPSKVVPTPNIHLYIAPADESISTNSEWTCSKGDQ